jgi:hypothetical protein
MALSTLLRHLLHSTACSWSQESHQPLFLALISLPDISISILDDKFQYTEPTTEPNTTSLHMSAMVPTWSHMLTICGNMIKIPDDENQHA